MNQPALPNYLPAVNRQLEYQAGLLAGAGRTSPKVPTAQSVKNRLWLGTDFTHIIVAR